MMAVSLFDGKKYFFVDKCLPFGASISCSHFQRVSDGIAHIVAVKAGLKKVPVNYLDDFLFAALRKLYCDYQVRVFLSICDQICLPVCMEKTFWEAPVLMFLGLLIDTINQFVSIPVDKVEMARTLVRQTLNSKKVTVHQLQKLTGFLNFLCKCIVPGRTFTRRLYYNISSRMLPHYHLNVNSEMKEDLRIWEKFLNNQFLL